MVDDRLLRKHADSWQWLLQEVCFVENVAQFTWARLAALVGGECMQRVHGEFFGDMKKMPWALCFGDIVSNLICLEALEGETSNLVASKILRLLQAVFTKDRIKRRLMLVSEIPWSTLPVVQAHGSTTSTHKLHAMMSSEMMARRSMLRMSRALFFPDAEDRCVVNRQKVIERFR